MPVKFLVLILIFTLPLVPTFWAILDIPKRRFPSEKRRLLWFFTVATLPFFGGVFYILLARRHTEPLESRQEQKEA